MPELPHKRFKDPPREDGQLLYTRNRDLVEPNAVLGVDGLHGSCLEKLADMVGWQDNIDFEPIVDLILGEVEYILPKKLNREWLTFNLHNLALEKED